MLDVGEALVERKELLAAVLIIVNNSLAKPWATYECMDRSTFSDWLNPTLTPLSPFLPRVSIVKLFSDAKTYIITAAMSIYSICDIYLIIYYN